MEAFLLRIFLPCDWNVLNLLSLLNTFFYIKKLIKIAMLRSKNRSEYNIE